MDVRECTVLFNRAETPVVRRLGVHLAYDTAEIAPARFAMLSLGEEGHEHLLPRPFSMSDTSVDSEGRPVVEFLYKVVGRVTGRMAGLREGDVVRIFGPCGNGFPNPAPDHRPVLLAGGIGNAPFPLQVRRLAAGSFAGRVDQIVLFLAGRTAEDIYIQDIVRELGVDVREVTDDGSRGFHGRITDALLATLQDLGPVELFACGPEPMLAAVQRLALANELIAHLAVETPMACGYGVCNACVVEARVPGLERGESPFKKACVEGPVFECREIYQ